ncbi:MAG: substrate-binding domain-containing protein [Pararhizobium sp.]
MSSVSPNGRCAAAGRRRWSGTLLVLLAAALVVSKPAAAMTLRVCADPNNMPFSNKAEEGFENRLVDIVARALNATVSYTWWAERRGFIRETLNAGKCDLVPGTLAGLPMLRTTAPYYRSSYVFVTRSRDHLAVRSFDDPVLRTKRIGVQLIGDDGANSPPAHALVLRGMIDNLRGYPVYGDYASRAPARAIIDALDRGDIDVAVVWGPTAGYFAAKDGHPLTLTPVEPSRNPTLPMAFDIAMGLRKGDKALAERVDQALARQRPAVEAILKEYHVPLVEGTSVEDRTP